MILLHLFACGGEKRPESDVHLPANVSVSALMERMPLVLPLGSLDSDTYYDDSSARYLIKCNRMTLRRPLPEIHLSSGQDT